ncbi:MAG: hypothetical protein U0636_13025 [Phycisphaerales bacterium]
MQTILHFRGQALTQFVIIASILGGFSMSGVFTLLGLRQSERLRRALIVVLMAASLAFVLACAVAAMVIPFTGPEVDLTQRASDGLMALYTMSVRCILAGMALLAAGLGLMGFLVSRRIGMLTAISAVLTMGTFLWAMAYLSQIMS